SSSYSTLGKKDDILEGAINVWTTGILDEFLKSTSIIKIVNLIQDTFIDNFYEENFLLKEDKICLEKINLAITHHYLHKSSKVDLKKDYEYFLKQARDLLSIDQEFTIFKNKCEISYTTLQATEKEIMSTMERSLDLFIKLLQPVIDQVEKINRDIEKEVQETTEIVFAGAV
ncbi:MAG TPA: hypothetical protein VGZ69_06890, partial [Candidatus Rhabdochlamydia sp.]|nr:hypothetical protein [Candidatus Rhabdochlamydia sp.]